MKLIIKDINGDEKINGDYESLIDCIKENKDKLTYAVLNGMNLSGADLSNIDFTSTQFIQTTLVDTNFSRSNLMGAMFNGSNLTYANFEKSNLINTKFDNALFFETRLFETNIICKQLYKAHCIDTKLEYTLLKIQGSRDLFCGYGGMVKINIDYYSIEDWMDYVPTFYPCVLNYTKYQIEEYSAYFDTYKKIWDKENPESIYDNILD